MDIVTFFLQLGSLKQISRRGWKREKIKNSETVAAHSFGIAILAEIFAAQNFSGVDGKKLKSMALIHDIGEISNHDPVVDRGTKIANVDVVREKNKEELEAIYTVFSYVALGEHYRELFNEFIEGKTQEAQIIKQLDKLEMALQAFIYEGQEKRRLDEFFDNAAVYISHPFIKNLFTHLLEKRSIYFKEVDKKTNTVDTCADSL